ncbi:TIGR02391 family protein [Nocardioides sp. NPDC057772]|uniref:TIGR02391 family protein n=1 Tax=Nocardioides sp. NPDC057772 TaxID=3346245 RepID=UPI00366FBADD
MNYLLDRFERIVRSVGAVQAAEVIETEVTDSSGITDNVAVDLTTAEAAHPFETRNIHPDLPPRVRKLFDDGHWEESVFNAFKFIENEVKRISGLEGKTGYALMMDAFNEASPDIQLNTLSTQSQVDEQKGFKFIFAGAATGIRNPRGHEVEMGDTPDEALDYLALASLLLRRLDVAGLRRP